MGSCFSRNSKKKACNKRPLQQPYRSRGARTVRNQRPLILMTSYEMIRDSEVDEKIRGQGSSTATNSIEKGFGGFPKIIVYDTVGLPSFPDRQKASKNKDTGADGKPGNLTGETLMAEKPGNQTGETPMDEKQTGSGTHSGKSYEEPLMFDEYMYTDSMEIKELEEIRNELYKRVDRNKLPSRSFQNSLNASPIMDMANVCPAQANSSLFGQNRVNDPVRPRICPPHPQRRKDANTRTYRKLMMELKEKLYQGIVGEEGELRSHAFQSSLNGSPLSRMSYVCPPRANAPLFDQNRVNDPVGSRTGLPYPQRMNDANTDRISKKMWEEILDELYRVNDPVWPSTRPQYATVPLMGQATPRGLFSTNIGAAGDNGYFTKSEIVNEKAAIPMKYECQMKDDEDDGWKTDDGSETDD